MVRLKMVAALWVAGWLLVAAPEIWQLAAEERAIGKVAERIARSPADSPLPQRVQEEVERHVQWLAAGREYDVSDRPALRQTAWQTWRSAEGTCGDGARLIVVLLNRLGVRAARINLYNDLRPFGHTAVAYERRGRWYFLDSIGSFPAFHAWATAQERPMDSLSRFNGHSEGGAGFASSNPFFTRFSYFDFTRIVGSGMLVHRVEPPSRLMVQLLEKPPLLIAVLKLIFGLATLPLALLAYAFWRRRWRAKLA